MLQASAVSVSSKLKVIELSHADRFVVMLPHCRGIRRIVQYLNMLLREQAPDEQYTGTGQHGSLLTHKLKFHEVNKMFAYHVVTERPMYIGQQIIFDEVHHSGVYQRVYDKIDIVNDIYANPAKYDVEALEHHTSVALRELALEEVRQKKYPQYPSRMACLYVSKSLEEAENWGKFFAEIGRPTYHIVKLKIKGNCFIGDATKCFKGQLDKKENLRLAEAYWECEADATNEQTICEMLVDGQITVAEIVKEINANILNNDSF